MHRKVLLGVAAMLMAFSSHSIGAATSITVSSTVLGTTPQYVGFSQGDYVSGTNTSAWVDYSNANAYRIWSSPGAYPSEVSNPNVTSQSSFDARKSALRADPNSSTYINWSSFDAAAGSSEKVGSNQQVLDYALGQLNNRNIHVVEQISNTFSNQEVTDWAGKWELWQNFYAQAFYEAKNYNVAQFSIYNEPDISSGETPSDLVVRMQLASDAIHSAISDVNNLYHKSLSASVVAPTSAGSSNSTFQTWGQPLLAANRTDYEGNPTSYDLFNTYDMHLYSSNPSSFSTNIQNAASNVPTYNASHNSMPVTLTEFNWAGTSSFANSTNTLNTPAVVSGLAADLIAATSVNVGGLYAFKFSQTPYAGPNGTIPQPTGFYYLDSGNTDNITGSTAAAEAYRLYTKAFKGARERISTTATQVGGTYNLSADLDPTNNIYYAYASNTSTSSNTVTLDLTSWNIATGTQISVEEVSARHFGEVATILTVPANKKITFTQPGNGVDLLTVPQAKQTSVSLTSSADAMVRNNASVPSSTTTNYGNATTANVARNTAGDNYATYLKFNLAGEQITSPTARAILEVTGDNSNSNVATFEVYGILNNSWSESSIDWANAPDLSSSAPLMTNVGGDAFPVGHFSFNSSQSTEMLDVTPFLSQFGSSGLVSFVLVREQQFAGEANDGNVVSLFTHESSSGAPQLLLYNPSTRGPASLIWNQAGGTWNTAISNEPWLNGAIASPFITGDTVSFTDAAVGAVSIDSGGVSPAATNVSNSSGTYTFTGGGILSGALTKTNGGTLILQNANNAFTSLTVSGGTLDIESNAGSGSTLPANISINNSANLIINDSVATTASQITGAGNTTIGAAANVTVATLNQASVTNTGTLSITTTGTITNAITGTGSTTVGGSASVTVGSIVQNSLSINGTLKITPGATVNSTASASGVNTSSFSIGANGTLDVGNSKFVIAYGSGTDPDASVASLIIQGRNSGAWNGTGITSSSAAADPAHLEVLWADGSNTAVNVLGATSGNELIEVTQLGDANGDGTVDGSDFVVLASHFGLPTSFGPAAGDFDYSGTVDGSDFVALASNFGLGTPFTVAQINAFNSLASQIGESKTWIAAADSKFDVVPEPGSVALLALGSFGLLVRRRVHVGRCH